MKELAKFCFVPVSDYLNAYFYKLLDLFVIVFLLVCEFVGNLYLRLVEQLPIMSTTDRHWIASFGRKPTIPASHLKSLRDSDYMVYLPHLRMRVLSMLRWHLCSKFLPFKASTQESLGERLPTLFGYYLSWLEPRTSEPAVLWSPYGRGTFSDCRDSCEKGQMKFRQVT